MTTLLYTSRKRKSWVCVNCRANINIGLTILPITTLIKDIKDMGKEVRTMKSDVLLIVCKAALEIALIYLIK